MPQREPGCRNKVRYRNRRSAVAGLERMQTRLGLDGEVIAPYRCDRCCGWHLGHPPGHSAARAAARQRQTMIKESV